MVPIEPIMRQNLLVLARAYCKATGRTMGALSRQAHNDSPFFDRLANKHGTVSGQAYDKVMIWFDKNWPAGIERPATRRVFESDE